MAMRTDLKATNSRAGAGLPEILSLVLQPVAVVALVASMVAGASLTAQLGVEGPPLLLAFMAPILLLAGLLLSVAALRTVELTIGARMGFVFGNACDARLFLMHGSRQWSGKASTS